MRARTFGSDYIKGELDRVDRRLREPVTIYMLGGFVMIQHALKLRTKDIDVVTEGHLSVDMLIDSLRSLEYGEPEIGERGKEYVMVENRDAFRWDIFDTRIAGKLVLSSKMKERAVEQFKGKMMTAMALSKEDTFLLKSVADRDEDWERDVEDMALLARSGLDYEIVLEECALQTQLTGEFWEPILYDRCVEMRDNYDTPAPIISRLKNVMEERRTK